MERDLQLARSKAQYIYRDLMESLTISYRYESTTVGCLALLACKLHPSGGKQRNLFFYKKKPKEYYVESVTTSTTYYVEKTGEKRRY